MSQSVGPLSVEDLHLRPIAEAVDMPKSVMDQDNLGTHVVFCAIDEFSDGEVGFEHQPFPAGTSPEMQACFGERDYREGTLARRLREFAEGDNDELRLATGHLVGVSAAALAQWYVGGRVKLVAGPSVWVERTERLLGFDYDHTFALRTDPQTVVDYGPGLHGRFYANQQLTDSLKGEDTYGYTGLAKGAFVPRFLEEYRKLLRCVHPGIISRIDEHQGFTVTDDGIVDGCTRLLEEKGEGFADVVIASSIHSAGESAVIGVARAYAMLKRNGMLFVRCPVSPPAYDPGIPVSEMVGAALDAGFRRGRMRSQDIVTFGPNNSRHPSQAVAFFK